MSLKGYVIRDGKVVKNKSRKSVSRQIAERRSKRQTAVSRAKAQFNELRTNPGTAKT
jgi:hypothetical protein